MGSANDGMKQQVLEIQKYSKHVLVGSHNDVTFLYKYQLTS